jgi:CBS-domain-containing membrane protein
MLVFLVACILMFSGFVFFVVAALTDMLNLGIAGALTFGTGLILACLHPPC